MSPAHEATGTSRRCKRANSCWRMSAARRSAFWLRQFRCAHLGARLCSSQACHTFKKVSKSPAVSCCSGVPAARLHTRLHVLPHPRAITYELTCQLPVLHSTCLWMHQTVNAMVQRPLTFKHASHRSARRARLHTLCDCKAHACFAQLCALWRAKPDAADTENGCNGGHL